MKIILSRKGFDSTWGGYPSPILPDKRLVSLPIPYGDSTCYSDIIIDENKTYFALMKALKQDYRDGKKGEWFPLTPKTGCHLDPDINKLAQKRGASWKPLFGQNGSAQGHLKKKGIKEGDLFLFFGTYQETIEHEGKLQFDKNKNVKHVIFGYLQIGNIINSNSKEKPEDWMSYHPHNKYWDSKENSTNNTIYVAIEKSSWNANLAGAGVFKFDNSLVLTKDGQPNKSSWRREELPFFGKISYHTPACWDENLEIFKSARIGQEFVCEDDTEINEWAKKLIEDNILRSK